MAAVSLLNDFLANTSNASHLRKIVASNASYISLTFDHPALTSVMPWAGTHDSTGPEAIIKTFADVASYWEVLDFKPGPVFGDDERAATFGSFTYRSRKLGKEVTSPFSVYLVRDEEGKIKFMQFMEDTLLTTWSFKKEGSWKIESNPEGGSVDV